LKRERRITLVVINEVLHAGGRERRKRPGTTAASTYEKETGGGCLLFCPRETDLFGVRKRERENQKFSPRPKGKEGREGDSTTVLSSASL